MKTIDKCIQELEYVKKSIDEIEHNVDCILDYTDYPESQYDDAMCFIADLARKIKGIIGGCLYEN